MANVFLSYDHDDLAPATALAKALEQAGHTVWYDRHIQGGAQYSRKIEQALDAADAVLVLWSERSLDSPWVRDEAAEGRDREKLIPLSVGGVSPPMGFRQFQTIELGGWKGRGKVPQLPRLLEAIESQAPSVADAIDAQPLPKPARRPDRPADKLRSWLVAAAIAGLLAIGLGAWWVMSRPTLPVVAVVAGDASPRNQAAASDLYVKLGSLAQVGEGKWQLVDEGKGGEADLIFRTADSGAADEPRSNLVLLDGKRDVLLWSREFGGHGAALADLRMQVSLTAGRVLGCALESRASGGLKTDLLKRFLDACALAVENRETDLDRLRSILRSITDAEPDFAPAWSRLLSTEIAAYDISGFEGDRESVGRRLRATMAAARNVDPDMAMLTLAEIRLLPQTAFGEAIDLLTKASTQSPDNAQLQAALSDAQTRVGRVEEGLQAAKQAAALDPLDPGLETTLILATAYSGRIEEARRQLERFERVWAGTGALRDALWAFHLRFGDTEIAKANAPLQAGQGLQVYFDARRERSPATIGALREQIARARARADRERAYGWVIHALGEFGQVDEAFEWIAAMPEETVAESSYLLFRGPLAPVRADPRFMAVADRIKLLDYWRASGVWPDFCSQPGLPYDCKTEAAKYGR